LGKIKHLEILLISPGYGDIPPTKWKAVEHMVDVFHRGLNNLGHNCTYTDTHNIQELINIVNTSNADVVFCMYDDYIGALARYCNKPILGQNHYGYFSQPKKWQPGYQNIFMGTLLAQGLIFLSEANRQIAQQAGFKGFSRVLRNGAEVDRFRFGVPSKDVICVGKIEGRKRQSWLVENLDGKINIDFVGPIADSHFKEGKTCKYLGEWSRNQIYNQLTDYKVSILLSDGESAPLVIPEGLAAGCSILVSEYAAANLDSKPYISIVQENNLNNADYIEWELKKLIENNPQMRYDIRRYAETRFDWNVIVKEFIDILKVWDAEK